MSSAYFSRAEAWYKKGEYDKTLDDINEAIRPELNLSNPAGSLNPTTTKIRLLQAAAWLGKKNYDQALKNYDAVIEQEPSNSEAYTKRGSIYGLIGKLDESITDSTQAINIASQSYHP